MDAHSDFESLAARRELWISCLGYDDTHGLQRQVYSGVVDAVVFRMTIQMRNRAAPANEVESVKLNGLLFQMIDRSFFHAQTAAIRRLTDVYPIAYSGKGRDSSVYSLKALLLDMRDWAPKMTRSSLIQACAHLDKEYSWRVRDRHAHIDWLAGVTEDDRADSDHVQVAFFDYLISRLDHSCGDIREWATKYVAHAASPTSRVDVEDLSLSWTSLWEAYRAIAQVANIVRVWILEEPYVTTMPVVVADVCEHLDRPLVDPASMDPIRDVWRLSKQESDEWVQTRETVEAEFEGFLAAP